MDFKYIYIALSVISIIYISFTFPVYSTGDGGEFASVVATFGVAHPPGYPLYIQVAKLFSFIPVGNIAERLSILTVLFSILSLYILGLILKKLDLKLPVILISVLWLAFTYSYLGQSVVIKFYTLNLFLISVVLYLLLDVATKNLNDHEYRKILLLFFLIGIMASNHHTGLFVAVPFIITLIMKNVRAIKVYTTGFILFMFGFLINLYLYIRSLTERGIFFNPVKDFGSFWFVYNRQGYAVSSTDSIVGSLNKSSVFDVLNPFINLVIFFVKNFQPLGFILILAGIFLLFRRDKVSSVILITSFFLYSVFLANITLNFPQNSVRDFYIQAHQYYLPAMFVATIYLAVSLDRILNFLKNQKFNFAYYLTFLLPLFIILFNLSQRFKDQNFIKNYVPYYFSKANLSTLPLNSVFIIRGDQISFGNFYLKRFSGFRQDVCSLMKSPTENIFYNYNCWPPKNYNIFLTEYYDNIVDFAGKKMLFSYYPLDKNALFSKYLYHKYVGLYFILLPKSVVLDEVVINGFFKEREKLLSTLTEYCLNQNTDDYYTIGLCQKTSLYYAVYSKLLEKYDQKKSEEMSDIYFKINLLNSFDESFYGKWLW